MRVFISWSGDASKLCAEALRDWLPFMNPGIDPFVSSQDISKGERGLDKIANKLQDCTFGIVCVTHENQHAPWINFEAGALSRELGESKLAPFLLDLEVKDLSGPIAQFQATESASRTEVWALVKSLNEKCETVIDSDRLRVTFDRFWSDLEENLKSIRESRPSMPTPQRETSEILNELVALVREQSSRFSALENRLPTLEAVRLSEESEAISASETQNVLNLRRTIMRSVGNTNVIRTSINRTSSYPEINMEVSEQGLSNARASSEELQSAASRLGIAAVIRVPNRPRAESVVLAPF
ncbi:toll/interleukin-1 receptor domain-containing protein [Streptomyces sp. NPDC059766]|uniref:toll/interleukin-1 receptor domain-containing protein n=1 Tax=Streptomyces sp. NPDC059766 TaxID=3346940 RepID=UPI00365B49E8